MRRAKSLPLSNFARAAISALIDAVTTDGSVMVEGLGVFFVATRPARNIRHPVTGESVRLPESRELRFRAVKAAKERLK